MRAGGILMPIFSLPGDYGIGTLGKESYRFIDFLQKAGQSYWQILPIAPTSYGDSPYQSFSAFAGNPYFIDPDLLREAGYLKKSEYCDINFGDDSKKVNYELLYKRRPPVLKIAAKRFLETGSSEFNEFCERNAFWLDDYSLFTAIKEKRKGKPFYKWEPELKTREPEAISAFQKTLAEDIEINKAVQFLFFEQWSRLHSYAKEKNIKIIGDIPIYVALDSADVWACPDNYQLDAELNPVAVAGCPPDSFTEKGQLWGNPLFDWDKMQSDNFYWWTLRIAHSLKIYDILRIDHFRGFESYYAVPAKDKTAEHGEWMKGPGIKLFKAVEASLGKLPIIAEDLGFITPEVEKLLESSGFPGMKVLQFGFDSREDSDHLPHNYPKKCIAYTGTHDNDTALGWIKTAPEKDVGFAKKYLHLTSKEGYAAGMMRGLWSSPADTAIIQMQDALGLDNEGRINIPGTVGGNWSWRCEKADISDKLAKKLYKSMKIYKRLNERNQSYDR